jgi:hypothetical protein
MSSSKCSPLSPISYLEISIRRVPMQPECHSLWLLLGVCTYFVYMTLLYYEISLMHWSLHIMCLVCVRTFTEIDHDATRNMIGVWYATPQPQHVLIPWYSDHVICHPSHLVILIFHIPIIIPMRVPCQSLEPIIWNPHICPSLPCGFSRIIPSIISSSVYTSSLPWFYFQNLEGKPQNIWEKYSYVQLTQVHSKLDLISIWNLSLNSMK